MAEFDPNQYFKNRASLQGMPKTASITQATEVKLAKLKELQTAYANDQVFLEPDRSIADIAGDVGITAAKSVIGLPEAFVGLADIATGGQAGKLLENEGGLLGYRPKQAKELLDSWLSDAQKEANLRVQTADGFVPTLEAAIQNPSTIATAVGESAASILGGGAIARGLASAAKVAPVVAGALGEGILGAGTAAEGTRQESADGLLSGKQTAAALASGAGTAILGFAGGKLAQKMGLPDVDTMLASGELKSPTGFMKAVVGAGISEGVFEEMPQSAQEQLWSNYALDKPLTEGVGNAAAMGLLAGAAMGGMGGSVSGAAGIGQGVQEKLAASAKAREAQEQAAKTGDVTEMVKPGSASYAPAKAVDALLANVTKEDATPEQREEGFKKAGEVVARLEAERQAVIMASGSNAELQAELDGYKAELAKEPADSEYIDDLRGAIADLEKKLAKPVDAAAQKRAKTKLAQLDSELGKARESLKALTDVVLTPEVAKASVEQVTTGKADDEVTKKAVVRVLSMAVNSPDLLDLDTVKALASNKGNALNDEQRQYLSAFAESRAAIAALKDVEEVHQDVLYGGKGYVGISQYRESIQNALKAQDRRTARRLVGQLSTFVAGHQSKATAASQALAAGKGTPIAKIDGAWKVLPRGTQEGQVSATEFKVMNSPKLVQFINDEAKALNATLAEMQAAMNVFSVPATTGTSNVTNTPQQGPATQSPVERKAPEASRGGKAGKAVPSQLDDTGSAVAEERAAAVVEPSGLTTEKNQENSVLSVSADSTETPVEPIGNADATDQTEALPDGKLSGFTQEHPEGASVSLSKHFTQTAKRDGDRSARPLATVGNWLSNLVSGQTFTDDFIEKADFTGEAGAAKSRAIMGFVKKAQEWQGSIRKNLPTKRKQVGWEHQDPMSILLTGEDGQLELDENVKTAISYAVFAWAARAATASHLNDKETINSILGRDEKSFVSPAAQKELGRIGSYQMLAIDELGSTVMDALGLKAKADAPKNFEAKLKTALGTHAMQLAVDAGLMARTSVPAKKLQELREEGLSEKEVAKLRQKYGPAKDDAVSWFVAVARNQDNKVVPAVQSVFEANKGSGSVLDRMFKTEAGLVYPSLEPITTIKETTGKGMQRVPAFLKKVMLKNQASPRVIRKDPLFVLDLFTEEQQHQLIGVQAEENELTHRAHWDAVEAKNAGLIRQLQNFKDFANDLEQAEAKLDTPFYLPFNAWQQQRVGIDSTVVNPQASKIVRFLVGSPEWKTTVNSNDMEAMTSFALRVGEGLGVKTERMTVYAAVDKVTDKLNEDVFYNGIEALRKSIVRKEEITDTKKQHILDAVKAGGGNLHSLDALLAVAHQQEAEAKANGSDYTFETELMGEVDGVANGTMLNHVLLGAKHTDEDLAMFLEQGGFYTADSNFRQYNDYRGSGEHFDIYESTALKIHERLQLQMTGMPELESLQAIGGKLVDENGKIDRDLVKEALNPLAFGSSMNNVIRGMADNFLDKVYVGFEKLAKDKASQAEVGAYVSKINDLIRFEDARIPEGQNMAFYMGYTLKPSAVKSLQKAYTETIGEVVKEVIGTEFAAFLENRDALVKTTNQTYQLYEAVRSGVREVFMAELAAAGELPLGVPNKAGERKVIGDLSKKQEEALDKRMLSIAPTMRTPMSIPDNNKLSDLLMAKTERKQGNADLYQSEVLMSPTQEGGKGRSTKVGALVTEFVNPGVLMGSASTHATDSAIAHAVQAEMDVLNVHDAEISGLGNIKEVAQALNKQTFEKTLNYSPLSEAYLSLSSVIQGIAQNTKKFGMYPEVVRNLQAAVAKMEQQSGSSLEEMLAAAKAKAYEADRTKLAVMARLVFVDQYAFAGGNYKVTSEDRAQAQKMLEALSSEVPAADLKAVSEIRKALADGFAAPAAQQEEASEPALPDTSEEAEFIEQGEAEADATFAPKLSNAAAAQVLYTIGSKTALDVLDKLKTVGTDLAKAMADLSAAEASSLRTAIAAQLDASKPEFWGKLGTPALQQDGALVAFLESATKPNVGQLITFLEQHMKTLNQTRHVKFQSLLLEQLKRTADLSLPVQYITPSTPPSLVVQTPPSAARGWYVNNGEGIFVLSPEFKAAAITPEIMLHEMVHAALLEAVVNPNKRTQGMVNELTKLYEQAKQMVVSSGLKKHSLAVADLDEFIAWGLTNREFQKDVLSKLSMGSRTKANGLITGMKEFINKVTGILFAGSSMSESEQARNGVAVLVSNVSGLFAEVAEQREKQSKRKTDKAEARVLKMAAAIRSYSTADLFNSLNAGSVSAGFQEKLQGLLNGMVSKLHGPAGALKAELMQDQALNPLDVWLKALNDGEAPFASDVVSAGLVQDSEQQAFVMEQVEATVRAALEGNESQTKLVYTALNKLYTEAEQKITAKDFIAAGFTQDQYDFIFTPTKVDGDRSDYLSRFAALGLAHEGFNKLLQFSTALDEKEAKTLAEKVQRVFEKILDFFQRSMTGTWGGQQANTKLEVLVGKLVDIEAAHRRRQINRSVHDSMLAPIEDGVQKGFEYLRDKAIAAAKSDMVRKHSNGYVRGAGALVSTIAGDRAEEVLKIVQQIRDKEMAGRPGVMAGLLNEVIGAKEALQKLTRAKTNHDRKRKAIMNSTSKTVLESFANGGKDLSKAEKDSVTQVFLRTGAHHMVGTKTMQELETLLGKGKSLDDAIEAAEKALGGFGKRSPYFINQANVLGYYAATGKVADASMMMNAHSIAQMTGTPYYGQMPQAKVDAAVPLINQLVSLYALRYSDSRSLSSARSVLQKELARTDGMNGVELVVRLQKQLEQESLDRLFKGNPALMAFAYTPDIYNPHIAVTVANQYEGKDLELKGYKRVGQAQNDPSDPDNETKHLYVLRDGGLQPYLAGAFNLGSNKAKGSKLHSGYMNIRNPDGAMNASLHASVSNSPARNAALGRLFQAGPVTDLSKVKTTFMAPVVNEKGDIVNWRYLMTHQSKDSILERTNGFDKVLGTLAGTVYDKANSSEQNRTVIQALADLYEIEGKKNPHSYIEVSGDTPDAEMREIWNMLPKETKQMVRGVWGKDSMMVRKDSLDLVFGYRKLSMAKAFEKDFDARNQLEKLAVYAVEYPMFLSYKKQGFDYHTAWNMAHARSAHAVTKGEHIWQELVRETKDIIVVKTGVVLLGNVISNLSLLWAQGVPLRDMLHHHLVAMRGATAYLNDSEELSRLQLLVESGMGGAEEEAMRKQIVRLEDALARNPVGELIEAGLMPSIVEDVAADDDPYSYKSALVRKVDKQAQHLNKHVVAGARVAYMAHDTKLYQGLSRATQLSDFVARYTLYQHLISQKKDALGKEDAVQAASEAFVNYDIPMHRAMQYMDDMGLMMFTKYFLRIQRVIQKMIKEHPARVLGLAAFNGFHDLGPIVLDSSAVFRIGNNPFSTGPLTLLESLDELATVTAPMALIK